MKARLWILLASALVAVSAGVALSKSNSPPEMHWKFLEGQKPNYQSVEEFGWSAEGESAGYTIGTYSNRDGPACQSRLEIYTLRADYDEVAAAAKREALAKGAREDHSLDKYRDDWRKKLSAKGQNIHAADRIMLVSGTDWWLSVSRTAHGNEGDPDDPSLPYVHVMVESRRNENFVGVARRWLRARFH